MKKMVALFLVVIFLVPFFCASAEYTDSETILAVQQALADLGIYKGNISGIKGNATEAAIRNYQKTNGMRSSGAIDDELLESLGISGSIDVLYFKRAVVVVATNSQATDVYKSDRMTLDKNKFHKYSDTSGFYLNIYSEGNWTAVDDNTWRVDSMILKIPEYGNNMQVSCTISYKNGSFSVTNMKKVISSNMDFSDPNKSSFITERDDEIYMTVPMSFVKQDRGTDKPSSNTSSNKSTQSSYDERKHKDWMSGQFSIWDGSHYAFTKLIKKNLNDEKSYKHIETNYIEISTQEMKDYINSVIKDAGYKYNVSIGDLFLITEFSCKNYFNATIKATAYGIARYSDDAVILLGIE